MLRQLLVRVCLQIHCLLTSMPSLACTGKFGSQIKAHIKTWTKFRIDSPCSSPPSMVDFDINLGEQVLEVEVCMPN